MSEDFEVVSENKETVKLALLETLLARSQLSPEQADALLCERCEVDESVSESLFYKSACLVSSREFGIPSRRPEIELLVLAFAEDNRCNLEDPDPAELELLASHKDTRPARSLEQTLVRLSELFTYEQHSHEAAFLDELAATLDSFGQLDLQLAALAASESQRRQLLQFVLCILGHLNQPAHVQKAFRLQHLLASGKAWTEDAQRDIVAPVSEVASRVEQLNKQLRPGQHVQLVDRRQGLHRVAPRLELEDPLNLHLEYRVVAVQLLEGRYQLVTCDDGRGKLHGCVSSFPDDALHMLIDEKFISPTNGMLASTDYSAIVENSKARQIDCLLVDGLHKSNVCAFAPSDRRVLVDNARSLIEKAHASGIKVALNVSMKLSSGQHAKRYKPFKLWSVSSGRELPVYQSFGRSKDAACCWLPNMADLRVWDCLVEDVQYLLDHFEVDGINLDIGHLLPILYKRDYAELSRRDTDGSMYHSLEDRLFGRYVLDGVFVPLPLEAAHPTSLFLDHLATRLQTPRGRKLLLTCDYSHLRRGDSLDLAGVASVMRSGFLPKLNLVELLQAHPQATPLQRFQKLIALQASLPVDGAVLNQTSNANSVELVDLVAHDFDVYAVFLFLLQGSLLSYDCELHRVLKRQHRCNYYEVVRLAHDYGTLEVAKTSEEESSAAATLTPK